MKLHKLALYLSAASLAAPIAAQDASVAEDDAATEASGEAIVVTGSRIKQDPNNSALPLTIITTQELTREGITSPEQLLQFLSTSGSGPENLASNADVVQGAQRGTNGLSSANLRGQGNAATLVLLNGRRVAAHGLSGSAVDVNQIPFSAMERVEILKDGASAIYGTDAIGGVINFITKTNYQGIGVSGNVDITERGDGAIYRLGGIVGYGDLNENGFNIMGAVSYRWNKILNGSDRKFTDGDRPNQGLSIDTRGTPIATAFNVAGNAFQTPTGSLLQGLTLTAPNGANAAAGGINILDLPGGAGCDSMPDGMNYDYELWNTATAYYACAWDTGRNVVLQQPIETLTYYVRGVADLGGDHLLSAELTGSDASSSKIFSNNQYSTSVSTAVNLPIYYPLNGQTASTYNQVFNSIRGAFTNPAQQAALDARYGLPLSFRWRCVTCGPREYQTDTKTFRAALGLDGPIGGGWDYRLGGSYAQSESQSVLGSGYHYTGVFRTTTRDANGVVIGLPGQNDPRAPTAPGASGPGIVGLFNSGIINPFTLNQSAAALAALDAVSAKGTTLYGGRYKVLQFDASVSGSLFALPGGDAKVAVGVDYRKETYEFNGSDAGDILAQPDIFNVAFDNANAVTPRKRNVKAAYAELLLPVFDMLELTAAARIDDYTGFGSTINPKFSFKFQPVEWALLRGSYNTGFRVPTFNQIFNRVTPTTSSSAAVVDPFKCPSLVVDNTPPIDPNCANITPALLNGGNLNLGPEEAEQFSLGIVLRPAPRFSLSLDWWSIDVDGTITTLTVQQLLQNASTFPDRFIKDAAGDITAIDQRWINAGARKTQGIEVAFRGGFDALSGSLDFGLDGTYLLKKKEKLTPTSPFGASLINIFSLSGDLGLRWKHNAFISYSTDDVSVSLSQIYRSGYRNFVLPNFLNPRGNTRPDYNERVKPYMTYNFAVAYKGLAPNYEITFGIRNLFDKDPPFAITYDTINGSGGSWEPRVADPRGRSFTLAVEAKF
ncbi:MAG: TonB-dependent receptor [Sphingorhabdus sp.]|nr:TonB-dependent receptor [Sphingorhabdus sp.]